MPGKAKAPAPRIADWDEDVFDVADNNLLRQSDLSNKRGGLGKPQNANIDWDDGTRLQAKLQAKSCTSVVTATNSLAITASAHSDDDHGTASHVQAAIAATWVKANALQDQAIATAVRAAVKEATEAAERERAAALRDQELLLQQEAEKATRRLWETAAREREVAIQQALQEQAAEVLSLRKALEQQKEEASKQMEQAYSELKLKAARDLEDQHSININAAVQAAWESAGRLQAAAVAQARKEAKDEAEREASDRMKLERLQLGADMRKTVQTNLQQSAEAMQHDKDELRKLRQELTQLKAELQGAEAKAAKQQQQAVKDAMQAMEEVAQESQKRAVARALAAAAQQQSQQ